MNAGQLASLQPALSAWVQSFGPCFKRAVTFDCLQCYLLGLMADLKRRSVEPIVLASDLYLPQKWAEDRARCEQAPDR